MKENKKRIWCLMGCLLSLLIFVQHHYVYMYFDDFGYASLSYGWTENKAGMSYTLSDICKFLSWHYFNWGGRILYFFFEILTFRIGGLELIQSVQAIIVILICIVSGKIVTFVTKCDSNKTIVLLLFLYGTINIETLRDGVYWYSASVAYVWPLLPFLGSIYFYLLLQTGETNFRKNMLMILTFLAAFSQEQVAVIVITCDILLIFFSFFIGRKNYGHRHIPGYLLGTGISAVLGGMITIVAPGNFMRAEGERYADFYSHSIGERLIKNIGHILDINIGTYNWVFVLIMTVFCGIAVAQYFRYKKLYIITFFFAGYFIGEQFLSNSFFIGLAMRAVWGIYFFVALSVYYYKQKNYLFLSLLIAGLCSQGMMVVSPTISTRCHTMMEFIMHLILAECIISISKTINQKRIAFVYYICIVMTCLYSIWNFSNITRGYKENYEINQINHYKLIEAGKKYAIGHEVQEISLYKLYDDRYANTMPYNHNHNFIEVWMRNYYELPEDIYLSWSDMEKIIDYCVKSGDYYDDHWLGREATLILTVEKERYLKLLLTNPENIENQQIICTIAGEQKVFELGDGQNVFEIFIPAGANEVKIEATKTFTPDNGDPRELSVLLDFTY